MIDTWRILFTAAKI